MINTDNCTRRDFLKTMSLGAIAMTMSGVFHTSEKAKDKTNIILIVADDLGYADLGCYGNPVIHTPNIDCLAAEGVSLTQHYSASGLCAPARASLLTGRYNHRTGAIDVPSNRGLDRIALNETTLADAVKSAGYVTGMVGKWHNGVHDMRYHPNSRGFDEFVGFLNGGMGYYKWILDYNGKPCPSDGRYLTDVFTQESIEFIKRHKNEQFFLYLAYNAPHFPLQAPEDLIEKYQNTGKINTKVSILYAMIEQMDTGIGKIMETLDKQNLTDKTIIVFTSDNGPVLRSDMGRYNWKLRGQKGDSLEGGIRVPAIVRWQNHLPRGISINKLIHFTDWFPTLLHLAGKSEFDGLPLDGQNVFPILLEDGKLENRSAFWFWQRNRYQPVPHCNAAICDGKWKLYWPPIPEAMHKEKSDNVPYRYGMTHAHKLMEIDKTLPERELSEAKSPRLYDLEVDPSEKNNLADRYPERVNTMIRQWDKWFEDVMEDYRKARSKNIMSNDSE